MERGLLADDDDAWVLTDAGCEIAEGITADSGAVYDFARQYQDLRGNELIADTYRRYPWYGINSQIADKVLRSDAKTVKKLRRPGLQKVSQGLPLLVMKVAPWRHTLIFY